MLHHHAFLFSNTTIAALPIDEQYKKPSQDVTHIVTDNFGIDDARALSMTAIQKPVDIQNRVFLIVAQQITSEAQNALLKLFEEPPVQALFYLVVPKQGILLPTLLSRLSIQTSESTAETNDIFKAFQLASYAKRMEMVADFAKNKDFESIEAVLQGAEHATRTMPKKEGLFLKSLLLVRSYIGARGSSSKMLLEELALTLP